MIYIIRHGQTDQNKLMLIQGQRDFPLNETGEAQAREARDLLRSCGISFDKVYSSPLSRAQRTAEIVTGGAPAKVDPRLIEMDYGPYEGCDLKNLPPEMVYFFKDFKNHPAPEGMEQLPDLVARLGAFLEDLRDELGDTTGENVLLSTHAIAMKAALEYLTPGSDGAYWSKFVPNCGIYMFDLVDGKFTVPVEFEAAEKAVSGLAKPVQVEQFVMAYGADQDRLRAMLPEGYESLRPVLRINTEIRDEKVLYIEFNTPVAKDGRRGWINIANWESTRDPIGFTRNGKKVVIQAPFLELEYEGTGARGGCPAEKDNDGCFFIGNDPEFRPAEKITENKEFCDCSFRWKFSDGDAFGASEGVTLPAFYREPGEAYEKQAFTAENAAKIFCEKVLGAYIVRFVRG